LKCEKIWKLVSSVFSISFHKFLPYCLYFFTIRLSFLPCFPYLFTIQLTFLPYFPYLWKDMEIMEGK
jgi:hypothetical protein